MSDAKQPREEESGSALPAYGLLLLVVGICVFVALRGNDFPLDSAVFYSVTLWLGGWGLLAICDAVFHDGCGCFVFLAVCWCAAFVWWLL